MQKIEKLPVIFRAERSGDFKGDVTAVFPTLKELQAIVDAQPNGKLTYDL